jgi:hypothetical protein
MKLVLRAAMRGVVAAMAMTGVRVFADHAGLIKEEPPSRLVRKRARGLIRRLPRNRRRAAVELFHWLFGAVFGAVFGLLPERTRQTRWAGPVFGLAVWLGFELGVAPALGLQKRRWPRSRERLLFLLDHLLFGFVLSEMRSRPRE